MTASAARLYPNVSPLRPGDEPVHKLSLNENPLGPSPKVVEACRQALDTLHRYPPRTDDALREALALHHGRNLSPAHFCTASGGAEVIELVTRAFLHPGDQVIICSPTYALYASMARLAHAEVVDVPLDATTFACDIDAILAAITPRTRLIFLCNPNNPTGTILTGAAFDALLAALPERVLVVTDEVYDHYVARSDYPDSIRHILQERPVICVHSFSKVHGLSGLRVGYGIARPDLTAMLSHHRRQFHLSGLALVAATAALGDYAHVARSVALAHAARTDFYSAFARLGVRYWPSEANFVLFRPPRDAGKVAHGLLRRGIMVRATDEMGLPGCLRVSTGLPEANMAFIHVLVEVLHRLAVSLRPYPRRQLR